MSMCFFYLDPFFCSKSHVLLVKNQSDMTLSDQGATTNTWINIACEVFGSVVHLRQVNHGLPHK